MQTGQIQRLTLLNAAERWNNVVNRVANISQHSVSGSDSIHVYCVYPKIKIKQGTNYKLDVDD